MVLVSVIATYGNWTESTRLVRMQFCCSAHSPTSLTGNFGECFRKNKGTRFGVTPLRQVDGKRGMVRKVGHPILTSHLQVSTSAQLMYCWTPPFEKRRGCAGERTFYGCSKRPFHVKQWALAERPLKTEFPKYPTLCGVVLWLIENLNRFGHEAPKPLTSKASDKE